MLNTTMIALLGIGVTCCGPRGDDSDKKSPAKSPTVQKVDYFERFIRDGGLITWLILIPASVWTG